MPRYILRVNVAHVTSQLALASTKLTAAAREKQLNVLRTVRSEDAVTTELASWFKQHTNVKRLSTGGPPTATHSDAD